MCLLLSGFRSGDEEALVRDRLHAIEKEIPLPYNRFVASYVRLYKDKRASLTRQMLAKSEHYFPMIERVLAENGLPEELKYMAVIESALDPEAVSRVGATGLWQFMYSTAREYRLSVGTYIDERSDPELSTRAAAQYLKNMYARYGDWLMVIASYNCGPGNVNKAIRRAGGSRDFWDIYRYLPRETRGYVPAFIGSLYVMEYAAALGLEPDYSETEYLAYTPVTFRKELLLSDLAGQLDIDKRFLDKANASLTGQIIPADYPLRIPPGKHDLFYEKINDLYASADSKIEAYREEQKKRKIGPVPRLVPDDPNLISILYTVKKGDNLGYISSWYDTGLSNLKAWNGMRRNKITVGQELIIYIHRDKEAAYSRFDKLSNRQKNILTTDRDQRMLYARRFDNKFIYHEVVRGDTYSSIAGQYEGASVEEIKILNKVGDRDLKPGMYLKIMKNG
jgi:membrane-bound lytic murein transglycosylase D